MFDSSKFWFLFRIYLILLLFTWFKILLKCSWVNSYNAIERAEDDHALVPKIPVGVSGTALAASLLHDGWSVSLLVFLVLIFFLLFVAFVDDFDLFFCFLGSLAGQNVCKIPRGCWCSSTWAIGKEGSGINIATGIMTLPFFFLNFSDDTHVCHFFNLHYARWYFAHNVLLACDLWTWM